VITVQHDSERHHRRSIRWKGYDYAQPGAYFVTLCTHERACLFGEVVGGEVVLNHFGQIVWDEWFRTADLRPHVKLFAEEFVVMPNHLHGIVWIVDDVGATQRVAPTDGHRGDGHPRGPTPGSLGAVIGQFKSAVTRRINVLRDAPNAPVWQRNYYEHVIRTDRALNAIRRYIAENPLRWHLDRYNPDAIGPDLAERHLWEMLLADARTHSPGRGEALPRPHQDSTHPLGRGEALPRPHQDSTHPLGRGEALPRPHQDSAHPPGRGEALPRPRQDNAHLEERR
jgi:REP element-mobilizing transposase RayT